MSRTFRIGADGTVDLLVFQPRPDGDDWRCDVELQWPAGPATYYGMGVDPMQALLLAIDHAHLRLLLYARDNDVEVQWIDGLGLGLPDGHSARLFQSP
ncbi:MAG: hypothetical protein KF842_03135 [Caulobacter sp.]|nr:hypothetical protein [Caulobacter sp.]